MNLANYLLITKDGVFKGEEHWKDENRLKI